MHLDPIRRVAAILFTGALLLGAAPASARAGTDDVFWFDGPTAAVTCAYAASGAPTLERLRIRGPRAEFPPSVGEVGWVRWKSLVQQRRAGSDTWTTIARRSSRITVDVYTARSFKARIMQVPSGPAGARIRVVGRIRWIDQGGHPAGSVQHVMRLYDRVHVEPGEPIGGASVEYSGTGGCPRTWSAPAVAS